MAAFRSDATRKATGSAALGPTGASSMYESRSKFSCAASGRCFGAPSQRCSDDLADAFAPDLATREDAQVPLHPAEERDVGCADPTEVATATNDPFRSARIENREIGQRSTDCFFAANFVRRSELAHFQARKHASHREAAGN